MSIAFHFLRPWWLLMVIPLLGLLILLWRQKPGLCAWDEVCDSHLLKHLVQKQGQGSRTLALSLLALSMLFMIISISGPTWHQLPVATYKPIVPRVIVLDMSNDMQRTDLTPNRLSRAKFILRDLFATKHEGQFALVVYSGEPFVVSPLTDDAQTISSLLASLTPDVMPVGGHNLSSALSQAQQLLKQAGYEQGQILVMTGRAPDIAAQQMAEQLAAQGIDSSIMPVVAAKDVNPLFSRFAAAGEGQLIRYNADAQVLKPWFNRNSTNAYGLSAAADIPLWRDEGRWFLIPALLLFLPVFRRGWLHRMAL